MNRGSFAKIKGFTLAEVLITLTIIGVIAAITVPTLYTKYQKYTFVVGLKKAYATLQNAVKMIPITEGCPPGDYACAGFLEGATDIDGKSFNGDAKVKKAYMLSKHMKVEKFCGGASFGKNTCYRGEKINDKNRAMYDVLYWSPQAGFITQDGMIWVIKWYGSDLSTANNRANNNVIVDVNGKKGPNIDGIDTFAFTIAVPEINGVKAGTVMPTGSKQYIKYVYGSQEHGMPYCKPPQVIGVGCAGKVLEENAINY